MNTHALLLWINRLLWTALVGAVLLVGAVAGLGRHYIGYLEQYREPLLAELSQRSGYRIDADRLHGEWRGVAPQVGVDNLRVTRPDSDEPLLAVQSLSLRFSLLRSLKERAPVFHRVEGRGVHFTLEEAAPGRWRLRGATAAPEGGFDALSLLLAMRRARLAETDIDVHLFDGDRARLRGDLRLERSGSFRRLALDARVDAGVSEPEVAGATGAPSEMTGAASETTGAASETTGAPLRALLEVDGDPRQPQQSLARLYTEFDDLDLTALLPAAKAFGLDLRHGRIDGRAWLTWDDGVLSARGHVVAPAIDLAALTGRELAPLTDIDARFEFERRDGVNQLWLPALSLRWGGAALQLPQLWLRREMTADGDAPAPLQLALPAVELKPLREALLAGDALPEAQRELLQTLAPAGTLADVQLSLPLAAGQRSQFALRATMRDVAVEPWHEAPGASGVDGYLELGADGGRALLDSRDASVSFPHVFDGPLRFDTARADVRWHSADGRTQLRSGAIALRGEAGSATAQVSLDLAHTPGEIASRMDLLVALRDSDTQYRDAFLPHTLDDDLLAWLKRAVVAGELPRGAFLYRGSLRPGDSANRTVQLHLDVSGGELAFQPEWPPLRELTAQLWLDDTRLQVADVAARMLDTIELSDAGVAMAPDPNGGLWLTVDVGGSARDDDLLRLLRESPLRARVGDQLDGWHWQGPVQFRLDLGLGIGSSRPLQVAVDADLGPGRLRLDRLGLRIDQVRGPLSYRTDKGLHSPGLTGALFGKPLRATVDSDRSGAIEVDVRGRLALAGLTPQLPEVVARRLRGETDLRVLVNLAPESGRLRASSSLRGVAVELPPPYAKRAADELPLQIDMALAGERLLRATVGDWGAVALRWPAGATLPAAGRVWLGAGDAMPAGELADGRLRITGTLPSLSLDDWRPLQAELLGGSGGLAVEIDRLRSAELQVGALTLRDLLLSGRAVADGWLLQASADRFDGEVLLPDDGPWRLHLRRLRLPAPDGSGEPSTALAGIDPRTLPAVDLRIDELWRGDELWGSLGFALRPISEGVAARQLRADIRELRFGADEPATLTWLRTDGGDRTWFDGRLSVGDLASVLARWGIEPAIVTESGRLDASVSWAGRPDQYALKRLNGTATLALRDGQLLSAGASAEGAIKLVGIFNVANLLRRLQLDFADLYKKGISFDRFDGSFALNGGLIELTQPLTVNGPSSRFRLAGVLDLNSEQVDMQMTATLPLAGNLPWIAALTGGLPVAAGVFVASKVFGDQVDRFSSAVYTISGSWRDPQVAMSHIFDARGDGGSDKSPRAAQEAKP